MRLNIWHVVMIVRPGRELVVRPAAVQMHYAPVAYHQKTVYPLFPSPGDKKNAPSPRRHRKHISRTFFTVFLYEKSVGEGQGKG